MYSPATRRVRLRLRPRTQNVSSAKPDRFGRQLVTGEAGGEAGFFGYPIFTISEGFGAV